jgi:hypothetical protein
MSGQLLAIHFATNRASEAITPQDVIKQASEVFARVPLSAFADMTEASSRGFSATTAKKGFLQHSNQHKTSFNPKTWYGYTNGVMSIRRGTYYSLNKARPSPVPVWLKP